jgi:GlcNAc-PI de-N-acetylase
MSTGQSRSSDRLRGSPAREPHGLLPAWPAVLAVVAHPDDESFGLGAIIDKMTSGGAAVHVLCYTRGEASTLNQTGADLLRRRARELRQAGAALGVSTVALLDYPDGRLAAVPVAELAAHVSGQVARHHPGGLLVFDDSGITGHPDHQAATQAAIRAAGPLSLPVLAWALPGGLADRPGGSTSPSGSTGPGSARPRCCMPARSRPQRRSGGGWSCKETSSTCAGSCRRATPPEQGRPGALGPARPEPPSRAEKALPRQRCTC